jgi:hypothetical protein
MNDEGEKLESAEVEALDEDPPTEADFLRQLNENREPADDDPPEESDVPPDVLRSRAQFPSPPAGE